MIETKDFTLEVAYALKDVFVANIEADGETVNVRFVDGQTFQLKVEKK